MTNFSISTVSKWRMLADALIAKTRSGEVKWRSTADEEAFVTSLSGMTINFYKRNYFERDPDFVFEITNQTGSVIDTFDQDDIEITQEEYIDGLSDSMSYWRSRLSDFMLELIRAESGADEALEKLLKALTDYGEIPY